MKRFLSFLLTICIVTLTFGACSDNTENNKTTAPANTATITFVEGKTVLQTAKLLEENGICAADAFIAEVNASASSFAASIENPSERPFLLEGYVFPDTYEFYLNESPGSVLSRFLKNSERKLDDAVYTRASELGYTVDEIIIIASIIQKEAGIKEQMNTVSSVLHNRLNSSYSKLECDVTYNYIKDSIMPFLCGEEWNNDVYEKYADLYFTYRFGGLPAGPICNPGMAAINAALYPADTDYYYFVTDSDGTYYYSKTFAEHQKICNSIS